MAGGDALISRRTLLATAAGGLLAAPLAARAQPARGPVRIGLLPLGAPSSPYDQSLVDAFRQGLREAGVAAAKVVGMTIPPSLLQRADQLVQ